MFKLDRILVPIDFSECSEHAFRYAVDLAARCNASITALYIETLHGEIRDHVRDQMNQLVASAGEGIQIGSHAERGIEAAPTILDFAQQDNSDLVVMGTHGRRGFRRFVIGSIASETVQHAKRPVLTVRGGPEFESFEFPPKQILAPIDFAEASLVVIRNAKELASFYGADVHLLHVIEDRFHPAFYGPGLTSVYDIYPDIEARSCKHLRELYHDAGGPEGPFTVEACSGHPSDQIVQHAEDEKSQLIVLATHGLTGLEHFILGSVAERVIRVAPCPVFTVRA